MILCFTVLSLRSHNSLISRGSNSPLIYLMVYYFKGLKGDQGESVRGEKGSNGVAGALGPQGPTGAKGETGEVGVNGESGATGATGATGVKGAHGDKGDIGPGYQGKFPIGRYISPIIELLLMFTVNDCLLF